MASSYDPPSTITSPSAIIGLSVVMLFFGTVATGLRFYGRRWQRTFVGMDDWTILAAYFFFLALNISIWVGLDFKSLGYNLRTSISEGKPVEDRSKATLLIQVFSNLTLGFTKLSALFFYRRVLCAPGQKSIFHWAVDVMLVIVTLWTITFFIFPLAVCGSHIDGLWIVPLFEKYCTQDENQVYGSTVSDFILEGIVFLLPIPQIWRLQMSIARRLAVTFVFLTGAASLGASAARLAITVINVAHTPADGALLNTSEDFVWLLESSFALFAVNLPSLWALRATPLSPEKLLRSFRSAFSLELTGRSSSHASSKRQRAGIGGSQASSEGFRSRKNLHAVTTRTGNASDGGTEPVPSMPKPSSLSSALSSKSAAAAMKADSRTHEQYSRAEGARYGDITVTTDLGQKFETV